MRRVARGLACGFLAGCAGRACLAIRGLVSVQQNDEDSSGSVGGHGEADTTHDQPTLSGEGVVTPRSLGGDGAGDAVDAPPQLVRSRSSQVLLSDAAPPQLSRSSQVPLSDAASAVESLARVGVASVYSDVEAEAPSNVGCLLRASPTFGELPEKYREQANRFCSGQPSSHFAALQAAHGVQQYLRSAHGVASFHSLNAYGTFRSTWIAAVHSLVADMTEYLPIPGEVNFPFIPRLVPVLALSAAKQALLNSGSKSVQVETEMENLLSTSPRIDDSTAGESFIYFDAHACGGCASREAAKSRRLIRPMVDGTVEFLSRRASSPENGTAQRRGVEDFWATSLMDMWEALPTEVHRASTVVLMVSYGTDEQVGKSVYRSAAGGRPRHKNHPDRREDLLLLEEKMNSSEKFHQMRVRPWSAIEMLDEHSSFGAGATAAFRLMEKEQVKAWNDIYGKMVALLRKSIGKKVTTEDVPAGFLELDMIDESVFRCCCPQDTDLFDRVGCKLVRKDTAGCFNYGFPRLCSCLLPHAWLDEAEEDAWWNTFLSTSAKKCRVKPGSLRGFQAVVRRFL